MTTNDAPRPALDAATLAGLLPAPCPVCGKARIYTGQGVACPVPVPDQDDDAAQNAAARHWLASYQDCPAANVAVLLNALPGLLVAVASAERYRAALEQIGQWDCLNPPNAALCADFPWLRALVDAALTPQEGGGNDD